MHRNKIDDDVGQAELAPERHPIFHMRCNNLDAKVGIEFFMLVYRAELVLDKH